MTSAVASELLFENVDSKNSRFKTYHIFGTKRGGTTSVAGLVRLFGIPIGENLADNLEDPRFYGMEMLPKMPKAIADSNRRYDVWGWKFPHSVDYLEEILPNLRNPRFIVVTRDPTALHVGLMKRKDASQEKSLFMAFNRAKRNYTFVQKHRLPTLFLSYEKLLLRPESAINELADYVGCSLDKSLLQTSLNWVEPGKYKPTSASKLTV